MIELRIHRVRFVAKNGLPRVKCPMPGKEGLLYGTASVNTLCSKCDYGGQSQISIDGKGREYIVCLYKKPRKQKRGSASD